MEGYEGSWKRDEVRIQIWSTAAHLMPIWIDRRPATSLMGARMGREPSAFSMVSYAMQVALQ